MDGRFSPISYLAVALVVGLAGCDLSPPTDVPTTGAVPASTPAPGATANTGTSGNPTPSPSPGASASVGTLGTLRGFVSGRNGRIGGVRVTVGSAVTTTALASASATDENGNPITLSQGEFILPNISAGAQTVTFSFDDASRSVNITVGPGGETRLSPDVPLQTDGPVPDGSTALTPVAFQLGGATELAVEKASDSAPLQFNPQTVGVQLKSPPNGEGALIHSYSFAYVQTDATMSQSLKKPLPSNVTVLPAIDYSHSGPVATLSGLDITDSSNALQSSWGFVYPDATLDLFFYDDSGNPIVGRAGTPLVVQIPCHLIH